jgi:hypothetical protein
MKKIKYFNSLIALSLISIILISCDRDEVAKPEILDFKLGYNNDKTGWIGGDLHIDAEIVAGNSIDRIEIEIHYEGDHKKGINPDQPVVEWQFEYTYTEFQGLRNTVFHEHIEIPLNAKPGEYHFHFMVIDALGYTAEIEEELEIKVPVTD